MFALAWLVLLHLHTDVVTSGYEDCRELSHIKGNTFSLFATIHAINRIKQKHEYHVDYVLASGTLLAFERNAPIFPWDSDADIFLIFADNLNDTELARFASALKLAIDEVLGADNNAVVDWHEEAAYRYFGVHALDGLAGWLDAFVLFWDDDKRRLRAYNQFTGIFNSYQPESMIFPIRYNEQWPVYNFPVNVPNKHQAILAADYGYLYKTPNVESWRLQCRNVNSSLLREWMRALHVDVSHIDDSALNEWMNGIHPVLHVWVLILRHLAAAKLFIAIVLLCMLVGFAVNRIHKSRRGLCKEMRARDRMYFYEYLIKIL